jgi:hypothetical protein
MRPSHRVLVRVVIAALVLAPLTAASPAEAQAPTSRSGTPAKARRASVPITVADTVRAAAERAVSFDFPATHVVLSWRGGARGIVYRTVHTDGGPTRWRRAHEDDTAGSSDRRFTGVLAVGRSTTVEWRASADPRRLRAVRVHYMNTLDGPRRLAPTAAGRTRPGFDIVTRAQWGANESIKKKRGGCRRAFFPVQQLFVHHTAGVNFDPHPEATMRAIYYFHTVTRGWCDIGYNFVISPDGRVFEGRWARSYARGETHDSEDPAGRGVRGAHVENYNSGSLGISLMGNYSTTSMSKAMRTSLVRVLAWQAARHRLEPLGRHTYVNPETGLRRRLRVIAAHRDAGQTACPGGTVYRALPSLRRAVAREVVRRARSRTNLLVGSKKVTYGKRIVVSGKLATRAGDALGGRRVGVFRRTRRWRLVGTPATGVAGAFSVAFRPRRNVALAAKFEGGSDVWGSTTRALRVRVRPRLALRVVGGTVSEAVTRFPSGTTSVPLRGRMAPAKRGAGIAFHVFRRSDAGYVRAARRRRRVSRTGAYRFVFRPGTFASTQSYRARVWFGGDRRHARGHSRAVRFEIAGE